MSIDLLLNNFLQADFFPRQEEGEYKLYKQFRVCLSDFGKGEDFTLSGLLIEVVDEGINILDKSREIYSDWDNRHEWVLRIDGELYGLSVQLDSWRREEGFGESPRMFKIKEIPKTISIWEPIINEVQ